jgi:hypothetical protein
MKNKFVTDGFRSLPFLLFLSFLLSPVRVAANVGPPSVGGTIARVPTGLEEIFITRERLLIDMRPLGRLASATDEKTVRVEAVYELENRGGEKRLELVFAVGSENANDFQLFLDDQPVSGAEIKTLTSEEQANLPESWQPPESTPWHVENSTGSEKGGKLMYFPRRPVKSVGFTLTVPSGKHTLKAAYNSQPAEYLALEPLKAWQFAYILAPAREWADFGGLDVTVYVPEGWDVVTSPELAREGDALRGSFDKIPADALAVTVRSREPAGYRALQMILQAVVLLVILAFPFLLYRRARRSVERSWKTWARGIVWSVLWAVLFSAAAYLAFLLPEALIPEAQFASYGYARGLGLVFIPFLSAALIVPGLALWAIAVYRARKRQTSG